MISLCTKEGVRGGWTQGWGEGGHLFNNWERTYLTPCGTANKLTALKRYLLAIFCEGITVIRGLSISRRIEWVNENIRGIIVLV